MRRGHWNYLWNYFYVLFSVNLPQTGYQKLVVAAFESISIDVMWGRDPFTQLSARGISSAVRLPFYYRLCSGPFFNFISKLLFKTSLASFFLSRCLPPVLSVRILSLSGCFIAILSSYAFHWFVPILTPFPLLRYRLCRLKISSGSNCGKL